MENNKRTWKNWIAWFFFAIAVIVVFKTIDNFEGAMQGIYKILGVLMPFFIAILLAYLLYVPCKKIEKQYQKIKWKWLASKARGLSVVTVYIIGFILLVLAIKFLIPIIAQSFIDLLNNMQGYYTTIIENFNKLPEDSIFKSELVKELLVNIQSIDIKQYFNIEQLAEYAKGVMGVAGRIFDIFVSVVASVYILVERREILNFLRRFTKSILGKEKSLKIANYFHKANDVFFRFVGSQFLDAIVVGVLTSVAMSLLQVKYVVLLGFLIGLANMIPYFGAIFAVGVSIIITILTGGIGKAIVMALVVIVLQQIDANIINPKIVGNSLKISPLLVIFAVTIGGAYFGVLGMFLAVPVAAVIKIIIEDCMQEKEGKI